MLDIRQVANAFAIRKNEFAAESRHTASCLAEVRPLLCQLEKLDQQTLLLKLNEHSNPGALPTTEHIAGASIIRSFPERWESRAEALVWARSILENVQTCAVDGSQIAPSRDWSIPIGAVQAGCFINEHTPAGEFHKSLRFEIMTGSDLAQDADDLHGFPDQQVNLRRFELECQTLCDYMQSSQDSRALAFYDGSFILSFAGALHPDLSQAYVSAIRTVLDTSRQTRIPVVGYVDSSYAHDLLRMLATLHNLELPANLTDAGLLETGMHWGDRSELWCCARQDRLTAQAGSIGSDYYNQVDFTYLQVSSQNPPARLEIPVWAAESGLTEQITDIVRAECIVGSGYPYPLETADALAVLNVQDREQFYRIYQEHLDELSIPLHLARKTASKRRRR